MSHYSVAVFMADDGGSVDRLLRPYQEGSMGAVNNRCEKWDWYEVGGRWKNLLMRKSNKGASHTTNGSTHRCCDAAFVQNIDFVAMRQRAKIRLIPYKEAIATSWAGEENMCEVFPCEEDYINCAPLFSTYAVITPDGKWHAPGHMGWFGVSTETPKQKRAWHLGYHNRFIKPAFENNWYLVIVDCHI